MAQAHRTLHHNARAGTNRARGPVTINQPVGAHAVTVAGGGQQAGCKPDPFWCQFPARRSSTGSSASWEQIRPGDGVRSSPDG